MKCPVQFVALLAFASLAAPTLADAQQPPKVSRIGWLSPGSPTSHADRLNAFRQGLRELGYVEGQNIAIEYRWAEGEFDRLPDLAADLVRLQVDVIVTAATPPTSAAKQATRTIPIVVAVGSDLIGTGLVASLARPGGNITGLTAHLPELSGKRLQLLKETVPRVSRVAVLWNPGNPSAAPNWKETEAAARTLGVTLQSHEVTEVNELAKAFAAMTRGAAAGLVVMPDPVLTIHRKRIADLAAKSRLPAIYVAREFVDIGGLMAYGPSIIDMYRRSATLVDKILKGRKPADLPVEQPMRFELVINMKTAKALGLTFPQTILIRADQVIE